MLRATFPEGLPVDSDNMFEKRFVRVKFKAAVSWAGISSTEKKNEATA